MELYGEQKKELKKKIEETINQELEKIKIAVKVAEYISDNIIIFLDDIDEILEQSNINNENILEVKDKIGELFYFCLDLEKKVIMWIIGFLIDELNEKYHTNFRYYESNDNEVIFKDHDYNIVLSVGYDLKAKIY